MTFFSGWVNTKVVGKANMRLFGAYVVEGAITESDINGIFTHIKENHAM